MKPRVQEHRFDFRGGRNGHTSPVLLKPSEMPDMTNVTLDSQDGQLMLRYGSRRLHQTAMGSGAAVDGLFQWDYSGTKQLVAVCNGDLFYKTTDFGAWSTTSPTPALGSAERSSFATMRQSTSGAPLRLYMADGTNYWRWSGSALTRLSGTSGAPANAQIVRTYHIRNFLKTSDYGQHLFWSVLGDPEDYTAGTRTGGGSAMIDVLRGEELTAAEVVGNSLLVGTANSISRFTGYDSSDIQIEQDAEGISSVIGPVGKLAMAAVEGFAALVNRTGVYAASEREVVLLSEKWNSFWRSRVDRTALESCVVAYHEGKRQIWVAVPDVLIGDGENKIVLVYHLDLQAWFGPYIYSFGIRCMTRWEDSNGVEYLAAGCDDGFVRVLDYDTSGLDDVLYDGSGGSSITASVDFAPTFFNEVGPGVDKILRDVTLHAVLGVAAEVDALIKIDHGSWAALGTWTGDGTADDGSGAYRLQTNECGDLFQLRMQWTGSGTEIRGFTMRGHTTGRPA